MNNFPEDWHLIPCKGKKPCNYETDKAGDWKTLVFDAGDNPDSIGVWNGVKSGGLLCLDFDTFERRPAWIRNVA